MATNMEDRIDTAGTNGGGAQRLADAAGGIAEQAGGIAERKASTTMTQIGDTLDQLARAVRDAGDGVRTDQPQIAGIADVGAEQVERASQYLREHDAREVMEAAQDVARRQPAVVIGAGLALGVLVGRALKSAGAPGRGGSMARRPYTGYGSAGGQYGPSGSRQFGGSQYAAAGSIGGSAPGAGDRAGGAGNAGVAGTTMDYADATSGYGSTRETTDLEAAGSGTSYEGGDLGTTGGSTLDETTER